MLSQKIQLLESWQVETNRICQSFQKLTQVCAVSLSDESFILFIRLDSFCVALISQCTNSFAHSISCLTIKSFALMLSPISSAISSQLSEIRVVH